MVGIWSCAQKEIQGSGLDLIRSQIVGGFNEIDWNTTTNQMKINVHNTIVSFFLYSKQWSNEEAQEEVVLLKHNLENNRRGRRMYIISFFGEMFIIPKFLIWIPWPPWLPRDT